jgi:hypothetical protein
MVFAKNELGGIYANSSKECCHGKGNTPMKYCLGFIRRFFQLHRGQYTGRFYSLASASTSSVFRINYGDKMIAFIPIVPRNTLARLQQFHHAGKKML